MCFNIIQFQVTEIERIEIYEVEFQVDKIESLQRNVGELILLLRTLFQFTKSNVALHVSDLFFKLFPCCL